MRNLKKVLSLVLCVAMMLSVMVMSTGAVTITDADDISPQYAEAAEVLTGMGIINGYEDDSFKPQQSITRAEVAAMIYRVATGDVEDEKADINAGAKLFPDVDKDDWYAGYVNYCGDAEYIKGYEDDTFRADNNVTGYEVLAMILRALGYDSNKEFTGPTWTINVVSTATDVGMLKNLDNSVDLAVPASREVVAELIFQAIRPVNENVNANTEMVHWSLAAGDYRPDNAWNPESLGEKVFNLDVENDADMWGRPNIEWFNDKTDDVYAAIEIAPVETYKTAVAECDVYEDTGVSGPVNGYVNGQYTETTYDISKIATKENIGAQGQLVEVYDYTDVNGDDQTLIVAIDTFLAQVTDVTEAKFDPNNHLAVDATLTLAVYDAEHSVFTTVELENGADNWTYAEGDMLLVNAYADANGKVIDTGKAEHVGDAKQYVEIVSAAESFVGAQTTIHYNANTHTINGTEYNDACKFFRDDAGTREDYNLNWWLDQYGNVIGATAIADNYAVLKDMIWIDGRPGYAEATLVYMDGTEATVTVDSIDGNYRNDETHFGWWTNNDTTPALNDAQWVGFFGDNANVSSNSNYNGLYEGYALYRVDTNSDGSVNLEGIESYVSEWLMVIHYVDNATLNANRTALTNNNGRVVTQLSNDTAILVKNGDTYTACSRADLPTINWKTAEVFYSDADKNGIAENVYVKSYSSITGDYIFPTSNAARLETTTWGVIVEGVYIDGELTEVATTKDIANQLINNKGKLFRITDWVVNHDTPAYGMLNGIELVNEDNDSITLLNWQVNYLEDVSDLKVEGGILYVDQNLAYDLTDTVEVVYQNEPYTMTLADAVAAIQKNENAYGIWVEGDANGDAAIVYVGTRLDETTAISVVGETGLTVTPPTAPGTTYSVKVNDKSTDGTLKLTVDMLAESDYAYYTIKTADGRFYDKTTDAFGQDKTAGEDNYLTEPAVISNVKAEWGDLTVTVYTECAGTCNPKAWTIDLTGWDQYTNSIDVVKSLDGTIEMKHDLTGYATVKEAVDKIEDLNPSTAGYMVFSFDRDKFNFDSFTVEYKIFSSTALALAGDVDEYQGMTANQLETSKVQNGDIVMIEAIDDDNDTWYFAFQIEKQ